MSTTIYHGNFVSSPEYGKLECHEGAYVAVTDGVITGIYGTLPEQYAGAPVTDFGDNIIIPAFSDLHIHAPQFAMRGTGTDLLLFDWLSRYTFPEEAKFSDKAYAEKIYPQVIKELIRHGTLNASFFTTIHYDACDILFRMLKKSGMYAYSGIVNMDMNAPDYLIRTTDDSLRDTEKFIYEHTGDSRVKPILTPRFAPCCSEKLLKGLSGIAHRYGTGLQTHLVESEAESAWTKELFPGYLTDGDIYEKTGLLDNGPVIFAHVIFPEERDLEVIGRHHCMTVHCPDATANVTAGIMPVERLQNSGISISLGSDIGAGHGAGIYRQISRTVQLSKLREYYTGEEGRVTFAEAFHLATASAGSVFGNCGKLEKGYRFTALEINMPDDDGTVHTIPEKLERFCYYGDDRNIVSRYIDGIPADPDSIYDSLSDF